MAGVYHIWLCVMKSKKNQTIKKIYVSLVYKKLNKSKIDFTAKPEILHV